MRFEISKELAQAIADYLQSKPYREVAGLLSELAQLEPIKEESK